MKHLNCRHIIFFQISYKFLIKVIKQFQKTCNAWRSYHSTIIGNKGCNQEGIEICPHKSLSGSKQLKWHKLKPRARFNFKLPRLWLGIAKAVGGEGHLSMDPVLIRDKFIRSPYHFLACLISDTLQRIFNMGSSFHRFQLMKVFVDRR